MEPHKLAYGTVVCSWSVWMKPRLIKSTELCDIPDLAPFNASCDCLAASTFYLLSNPFIQTSPNYFDPGYHYKWYGQKMGLEWRCDLCQESNLHFNSDSLCECPEAAARFTSDYPTFSRLLNNNPHQFWNTHTGYGNVWQCSTVCNTGTQL